jgi:hypothetical protein
LSIETAPFPDVKQCNKSGIPAFKKIAEGSERARCEKSLINRGKLHHDALKEEISL